VPSGVPFRMDTRNACQPVVFYRPERLVDSVVDWSLSSTGVSCRLESLVDQALLSTRLSCRPGSLVDWTSAVGLCSGFWAPSCENMPFVGQSKDELSGATAPKCLGIRRGRFLTCSRLMQSQAIPFAMEPFCLQRSPLERSEAVPTAAGIPQNDEFLMRRVPHDPQQTS
jgi:hypothetical protein